MNQYVAELPWTPEQWGLVCKTVAEEAQRTRVAAKFLPIYGPVDATTIAVPRLRLLTEAAPGAPSSGPQRRFTVDSRPSTALTRISSLVYVRSHEAADPELQAVLSMFRRAASIIARNEDALMFNGQYRDTNNNPFIRLGPAPQHVQVTTDAKSSAGLLPRTPPAADKRRTHVGVESPVTGLDIQATGTGLVSRIVAAISALDSRGFSGPYACVLSNSLYQAVHTPTPNLVLPRHTILPFLDGGPLLRSGRIAEGWGLVVAHESGQVEQVLASDISVEFLQASTEPRFVFRVSERVALRIRDRAASAVLHPAT